MTNTRNYPKIKELLYSPNESDTAQAFQMLSELETISDYFLDDILNNPDWSKLVPTLKSCKRLSRRQLFRFSNYVKLHLAEMNQNTLINTMNFINEIQLDGFQEICLELANSPYTHTSISTASVTYVFENNYFTLLPQLQESFHAIVFNEAFPIETRVLSSFYLYRYTSKQEYIDFLLHQLQIGSSELKDMVRETLNKPYHSKQVFRDNDHIRGLV